jgi:CRISPR-associated RAMP protein (TIGR02581 family)
MVQAGKQRPMIEGTIVAISPIHVGAGRGKDYGKTDANLQIIRLPKGNHLIPYIPASSLKGVFRSSAETILRDVGKEVCNLFSDDTCAKKEIQIGNETRKIPELIKEWERTKSPDEVFREFWRSKYICDVCKIFGLAGYCSLLLFTNAMAKQEDCFDVQTMIAITPSGTKPRTLEYIKPGTEFDFSIKFRRFDDEMAWVVGLLLKIVDEINQQRIQIGGQKTRGYGWCRIELREPPEQARREYLQKWEEYARTSVV